jgi:flagellar biosynthesis/type III secretory pathway ATPase
MRSRYRLTATTVHENLRRDAELDQAIALVPKVYDALRQGPTDALSSDAFRELNTAIKQSKA